MSSYYHVSAEVRGCDLQRAHKALGAWMSSRVCQLEILESLNVVALDLMFYNGRTGMSADDFVDELGETLASAGIESAHIAAEVWDADVPTDSTSTGWCVNGRKDSEDEHLSDECPGCNTGCHPCDDCGEPRCPDCHPDACWRCGKA